MSKRKTITVAEVTEKANAIFRDSADEYKEGRRATQTFVEDILMKTGNYKGFRYLTAGETNGKSFGISYAGYGNAASAPTFHDQTRVSFY